MHKMNKIVLCVLVLYCTYFYSESSVMLESITDRDFERSKIYKELRKNKHDKDIQALCYQESNTGGVLPCDRNNTVSACILPAGSIIKCEVNSLIPDIPLCIKTNLNQQFIVSCNDPSQYLCFSLSLKENALEICRASSLYKICLGEENMLQSCHGTRFKREKHILPQLIMDGYAAMCDNCTLKLAMTIDEEKNEQPIIEIKSEPMEDKKNFSF